MKWGDLQARDVMHTTRDPEMHATSWLLLRRTEVSLNGLVEFTWLSLDDGAIVTTNNLASANLGGYRVEPRV